MTASKLSPGEPIMPTTQKSSPESPVTTRLPPQREQGNWTARCVIRCLPFAIQAAIVVAAPAHQERPHQHNYAENQPANHRNRKSSEEDPVKRPVALREKMRGIVGPIPDGHMIAIRDHAARTHRRIGNMIDHPTTASESIRKVITTITIVIHSTLASLCSERSRLDPRKACLHTGDIFQRRRAASDEKDETEEKRKSKHNPFYTQEPGFSCCFKIHAKHPLLLSVHIQMNTQSNDERLSQLNATHQPMSMAYLTISLPFLSHTACSTKTPFATNLSHQFLKFNLVGLPYPQFRLSLIRSM